MPVSAETGMQATFAPQSSVMMPYFGQALHHALGGLAVGLIHLVHGHDELDVGGLGVVDGLDRLGHDAVIGGDDQNCNIGHVGTAGAHGGERLVARGYPGMVMRLSLTLT